MKISSYRHRIPAIGQGGFGQLKSIAILLATGFAICGCTRIESVTWQSEPLVLHEEATVTLVVKAGWFGKSDLDALIEDSGNLVVVSKNRVELEQKKLQTTFKVIPMKVGNDLDATVRFGDDRSRSKKLEFGVGMPVFSGRSNASFLEMLSAPDTSIYGSHITMWRGGETQFVSGHAASNICRKISAAVIDFAISHALINEDFFVGAGFASLPRDADAGERLLDQLHNLKHPGPVGEELDEIADAGNIYAAYDLADLLEDPASYRPRPPIATHFLRVIGERNFGANTDEILAWIRNSEDSLAMLGGTSEFGDLIEYIKAMNEGERTQFAHVLRKYAAWLDSDGLLAREAQSVASRSGLVRMRARSSPEMKDITASVREWSSSAEQNRQTTLAAISLPVEDAEGDELGGLYELMEEMLRRREGGAGAAESGPNGLVFLPYLNASTGKHIDFMVPKKIIAPPRVDTEESQESLLDILRKSVSREMIANLEEAAQRQNEFFRQAREENIPRIQRELALASDPRAWLQQTVTETFQIVDERGQRTGQTETRTLTNFERWVGRLEFAETSRRQAILYTQSAKRIRENEQDPKATEINEGALLDSFLRGWDLAFVDNSNESPYQNWMKTRRDAVWIEIFRQASEIGVDLAPLISEQTVFQVRASGDSYRIRPMYVGEISDTTVMKSQDANLVYYKSPWMHRQVVYLKKSDVSEQAWTSASTLFAPDSPDQALHTLADNILDAALEERRRDLRQEGVRRAMVVDAKRTADRLIGDYWGMWSESDEFRAEQARFEEILSETDSEGNAPQKLLDDLTPDAEDRLWRYVQTRAFEGGLQVMRCFAGAQGSIEADDSGKKDGEDASISREQEVAAEAGACFSRPEAAELTALRILKLDALMTEVSGTLASSASQWRFDALGRSLAANDINGALNRLADPLLQQSAQAIKASPTKRAIEAYIRLEWYSGDFLAALSTTVNAVAGRNPSAVVRERGQLLTDMHMDILKALVYSGMELGSSYEPSLSLAAETAGGPAGRSRAYFGLRKSDFAMRPASVERIAYRIETPEAVRSETTAVDEVAQVVLPLPKSVAFTSAESVGLPVRVSPEGATGAGMHTTRSDAGIRKAIWVSDGDGIRAASFTDVVNDSGASMVAKFTTGMPVTASEGADILRAKGFELLQGKNLEEEFNEAVVLAYPDRVIVLAGNEALRFAPPADAISVRNAVVEAFNDGKLPLRSVSSDSGLLQEANYIASRNIDPAVYFASADRFPGTVAYARDATELRMLVRAEDGSVSSVALTNGTLRTMSTGKAAVRDIEEIERVRLAARSDDKVRFVHTSVFDLSVDSSITIQVGATSRDVPVTEIRAMLEGSRQPTPVLDGLFAHAGKGERPTTVIYRDALVRGGGGGRGNGRPPGDHVTGDEPPGSRKVSIPFPGEKRRSAGDPDREFMVDDFSKDMGHLPPIPFLVALKQKYPGHRFVLDDEIDVARANALNPVTVGSVRDIGVYLPAKSFRVVNFGTISNIRRELEGAGIHVEPSLRALEARNVLVISGHKDQALESYIEAHIKAGNLKGKQVLLFSCYQQGDAKLAHRMLSEGGAKGVVFFSDEINPRAVNAVVRQMASGLSGVEPPTPSRQQLIDLLDGSVEKAIQREGEGPLKNDLNVLRNRVPQISSLTRRSTDFAA